MLTSPASYMAAFGDGLMRSAEPRPVQTQCLSPVRFIPRLEQAMDLWHAQRTQFTLTCPFFCSAACAWVRITTRKA